MGIRRFLRNQLQRGFGKPEAKLIERRVTLEEFLTADAVAIGTPDYFSYVAGTIKTFFDDMYLRDQSGKSVKGKRAVLFCSHGGGGKVREPLKSLADRFFQQVGETVSSGRPISEEAKKKCHTLGQRTGENLSKTTATKIQVVTDMLTV